MTTGTPPAEVELDAELVRGLLREQFPDLAGLPLVLMDNGWDNVMYRLGGGLVVRLPRRRLAADLIVNEQKWLGTLSGQLPVPTPVPRHEGRPGLGYPWHWSILPWFEGKSGNLDLPAPDEAERWARFLKALHQPAPADAPHNPYRAVPLRARQAVIEERMKRLESRTDLLNDTILGIWQAALDVPCPEVRLWIHGDLHARNVVVKDGVFAGVIDWGDISAGDPAVDLLSVWSLFGSADARTTVLNTYGASDDLIGRAMGWAVGHGVIFLETGLEDDPQHLEMGKAILGRLMEDATS